MATETGTNWWIFIQFFSRKPHGPKTNSLNTLHTCTHLYHQLSTHTHPVLTLPSWRWIFISQTLHTIHPHSYPHPHQHQHPHPPSTHPVILKVDLHQPDVAHYPPTLIPTPTSTPTPTPTQYSPCHPGGGSSSPKRYRRCRGWYRWWFLWCRGRTGSYGPTNNIHSLEMEQVWHLRWTSSTSMAGFF